MTSNQEAKPPPVSFLGIGAQKSGTTWLYKNLQRHPQIWLPAAKELHYFSSSPQYPSPNRLGIPSRVERFMGCGAASREARRMLVRRFGKFLRTRDFLQLVNELKCEFGYYDDDWYLSLFRPANGRVAGEITPAYALLDQEDVSRVVQLLSQPKIIFIMRDPIDRAWSQLRRIKGNRKVDTKVEYMFKIIDGEHQSLRGNYQRTLDIWGEFIPSDRMFVCFFEEIRDHPAKLLSRLFEFLEVDALDSVIESEQAKDKVNEGRLLDSIPSVIEHYLAERYLPMLQSLAASYGSYPSTWLQRAEAVLSTENRSRVSDSKY